MPFCIPFCREFVCAATVLCFFSIGFAAAAEPALVADTEALTPAEQQALFRLPPGFQIELIAAEPEIQKPMNLRFTPTGDLLVTQSVEYPWPAKDGTTPRDTIRRIRDTNGDGVPDTVSTFAEGLNIPIGLVPVKGSVLGYSIPTLYRFTDADGDGKAEGREELYSQFGFRDTHGMCSSLGYWIDGWVYGCHGFSNDSKVEGKAGPSITMQSGNTYRLRPDGSKIEYYTHGQVNPFGLCFDRLGNVFTADCHTRPVYLLVRGAYYPSFGKPHDGLGFGPELMQHAHGSTGIAGVVYYDADLFPPEFRDNLFIGNPVTGRINRDTLDARGSTYQAIEQPDFVSCDDPWFRPVDLQLAPDGSIYVADFYNCLIGHYEVPLDHPRRDRSKGRIWRISYQGRDGVAPKAPADFTRLTEAELVELLAHPHLPVRVTATHQLVDRIGKPSLPAIAKLLANPASNPLAVAHGLWVHDRLSPLSDQQIDQLSLHPSTIVRVHLLKAIGERSAWSASQFAYAKTATFSPVRGNGASDSLSDASAQKAFAEAMGKDVRTPDELGAIRQLGELAVAADPNDHLLKHSVKVALRQRLWLLPELPSLVDHAPGLPVQQIAEVYLGMPSAVTAARLADAFTHPSSHNLIGQRSETLELIGRHLPDEATVSFTDRLAGTAGPTDSRWPGDLSALARSLVPRGAKQGPKFVELLNGVAQHHLTTTNNDMLQRGLDLVSTWRLAGLAPRVRGVATFENNAEQTRLAAVRTLLALGDESASTVGRQMLDLGMSAGATTELLTALGDSNRDDARAVIEARLKTASAADAEPLAKGLARSKAGAGRLLVLAEEGRISPRLMQIGEVADRVRTSGTDRAAERLAVLTENLPTDDERLVGVMHERKQWLSASAGNVAAGQAVFQKNCANCHRLANQGTKVGPELDGVGLRGTDRLLEDMLMPSRNVDIAFRSTVVELADGRVVSGLAQREEGGVLVMLDSEAKEQRIPVSQIEDRQPSKLSPMPANVAEKLSEAEFRDLVAYLLGQKVKPQ